MIDLETLKSLVDLMVENDLAEIDIRDGEETIKLKRGVAQQILSAANPAPPQPPQPQQPHPQAPSTPAPEEAAATADDEGLDSVDSPMVGTYYAKPNPDSPPFIKVGDRVSPDTVVCLIEAMKVFTEVKAETSGVIEKILVKDADAVEFGQRLILVRPD